jgi:hydroxymethylpyrimidine pyrophosphatase-like HAD family hydrolase
MKISAVFSDYDGTLAPEDVAIEASSVPKEIAGPLLQLGRSVPVAIITSKDFGFARPRTPFARAWACVSGLEIVLSDGRSFVTPVSGDRLDRGLRLVRRHDNVGLKLELKRSTTGGLLGFSVDWRRASPPPSAFFEDTTAELLAMGLAVVCDPARPFFDVFGSRPDKGAAVRELRRLLLVPGNILFIGDSAADNLAFEEADVAICVDHGQDLEDIRSGFVLRRDDLGRFLSGLAADELSLDLRALKRK